MTSWVVYSQYLPPCHEFWTEYSICLKDRLRTCLNLVVWCHPLLLVIAHPTICTSEQSVPPLLIPSSSSAFEQIKELKHLCVLNHPLPASQLHLCSSSKSCCSYLSGRKHQDYIHEEDDDDAHKEREMSDTRESAIFPTHQKPCTDQWSTMS